MIPFFDVIENNVFFPNKKKLETLSFEFKQGLSLACAGKSNTKKKFCMHKPRVLTLIFFHLVSGNYFLSKLKKKIVFSI